MSGWFLSFWCVIYCSRWERQEKILCTKLLPLYNRVFYALFSNPTLFTSAASFKSDAIELFHTPQFSIIMIIITIPYVSRNQYNLQWFSIANFPRLSLRSTANSKFFFSFGNLIDAFGVTHSYSYFIFYICFLFFHCVDSLSLPLIRTENNSAAAPLNVSSNTFTESLEIKKKHLYFVMREHCMAISIHNSEIVAASAIHSRRAILTKNTWIRAHKLSACLTLNEKQHLLVWAWAARSSVILLYISSRAIHLFFLSLSPSLAATNFVSFRLSQATRWWYNIMAYVRSQFGNSRNERKRTKGINSSRNKHSF